MNSVARFYNLTEEQLMELYQVILSESDHGFSYIKNTVPSYKNENGWQALAGKDPYELAKECKISIHKIPMKITDLEGLSVLADQRVFQAEVDELLSNRAYNPLGSSQLARQIELKLKASGFAWGGRQSIEDVLVSGLERCGKDSFALMHHISLSGKWLFSSHYTDREQQRLRRESAYAIKQGSYCLNDAAKHRLADHAAKLIDDNPATPIYFIEKFHRACARQGLSISSVIDDTPPERLNDTAKQVLSKAFFLAKKNNWAEFSAAMSSLEFRLVQRLPKYQNVSSAIQQIRQTLKGTAWGVFPPPSHDVVDNSVNEFRSSVLKQASLKDRVTLLYETLYILTVDDKESRSRLDQHWSGIWGSKDIAPLHEWDIQEVTSLLERSKEHFSVYLTGQHEYLLQRSVKAIDELLLPGSPLKEVYRQQLHLLMSAEIPQMSEFYLSKLIVLKKWFSPDSIVSCKSQDTQKRADELSRAFFNVAIKRGLSSPLGFEPERFENEDRARQAKMSKIT